MLKKAGKIGMSAALAAAFVLSISSAMAAAEESIPPEEGAKMPIALDLKARTYQNAGMQGVLKATDPDGGALVYEIVTQPKKGNVMLSEKNESAFVYRPNKDCVGSDSFTYVARDADGNVSAPATVKITIAKAKDSVTYADMGDAYVCADAIRLAEEGVFTGAKVGGESFFAPDTAVSRSEFLVMAMAAANIDGGGTVSVTGFYDDDAIPTWAKSYASRALSEGVIEGRGTDGGAAFSADAPITFSEAAAVLNRVLSVTNADTAAFATEDVPAWAVQSAANMTAVDVLPAGAQYNATVTRADAAQMLCAAMDLMEERGGGLLSWLKQ